METILQTIQTKAFDSEVKELKRLSCAKGKAAATFHLKRKILGSKKPKQDQFIYLIP